MKVISQHSILHFTLSQLLLFGFCSIFTIYIFV